MGQILKERPKGIGGSKMSTLTLQQAIETTIYYVDREKWQVESENELDFISRSIDETTTPNGVAPRIHLRHDPYDPNTSYEVWTWGTGGNHPRFLERWNTPEEARESMFQMLLIDFEKDDQRSTVYFYTAEDAEYYLLQEFSAEHNITEEVGASILRRMRLVEAARKERRSKAFAEQQRRNEQEEKRITAIAEQYATMIETIYPETFKETAKRLSEAIGEKIESKVFYKAVKLIRKQKP